MSTRWPAHVKRTPLTGGEGTRLCFTRPGDPPPAPRSRRPRRSLARRLRRPLRLAARRRVAPARPMRWSSSRAAGTSGSTRRWRSSAAAWRRCSRSRARAATRSGRTAHGALHAPREGVRASASSASTPSPYSTQGEARAIARLAREHRLERASSSSRRRSTSRGRGCSSAAATTGSSGWSASSSTWWKLPEEWASETGKLPCSSRFAARLLARSRRRPCRSRTAGRAARARRASRDEPRPPLAELRRRPAEAERPRAERRQHVRRLQHVSVGRRVADGEVEIAGEPGEREQRDEQPRRIAPAQRERRAARASRRPRARSARARSRSARRASRSAPATASPASRVRPREHAVPVAPHVGVRLRQREVDEVRPVRPS